MKIVIFGLSVSSAWGNGHATLWRGLCKALSRRGHTVVFYERDVPWYANTRDLTELPGGGRLVIYPDWAEILPAGRRDLQDADCGIVTSYCPDAIPAGDLILESRALKIFYDLDSPVTLARLRAGEKVEWVGPRGFQDYDLVLSYAGGQALAELQTVLGARRAEPLYGSADPEAHFPAASDRSFSADVSYLGTYSPDRDEALRELFLEPARRRPERRFLIGGSLYGENFPWLPNIHFVNHVEPGRHRTFYCSSSLTLNVTRAPMARMGYCPSGRLFEAGACGVPVLSDTWEGLDAFYRPGAEILIARTAEEAIEALDRSPEDLRSIGRAARERTLAEHTADNRAREMELLCGA